MQIKRISGIALLALALNFPQAMTAQDDKPAEAKPEAANSAKPESLKERISYSYGLMIGRQLTSRGVDIDMDQLTAGFKSVIDGTEPALTEDEVSAAFDENEKAMTEKAMAAGKEFLEENGKKEGVVTTDSGLQYEVLTEGPADGAKPAATDKVKVHYHGTLIDGTVFDSSVERGEPISFPLNGVIPGWTEGVQLMPVGAKYRFFIPYDLAYGERGSPPVIPPFSTLIFDVELLGINE